MTFLISSQSFKTYSLILSSIAPISVWWFMVSFLVLYILVWLHSSAHSLMCYIDIMEVLYLTRSIYRVFNFLLYFEAFRLVMIFTILSCVNSFFLVFGSFSWASFWYCVYSWLFNCVYSWLFKKILIRILTCAWDYLHVGWKSNKGGNCPFVYLLHVCLQEYWSQDINRGGEEGVGSRDDLICPHCQSNDLRKSWKRRQSEYKFNMQVLQCKNHDLMAVVSWICLGMERLIK